MEEQSVFRDDPSVKLSGELKLEEDEEEFRSCCEDEDELKEREELVIDGGSKDDSSVKMFFKGISVITQAGESGSGVSGIGVFMERSDNIPIIRVQKKLDFYVEETVANYLALIDGLLEALSNKISRVFAFTDSQIVYDQIMHDGSLENPLLVALKQRILEHTNNLDTFVLKLVSSTDLEKPLHLARVATGIVSLPSKEIESFENCSICCEEKTSPMIMKLKCSHKFCSHCMKTYVEGKLESSQVPIRCPQLRCKYHIGPNECKSFLPVNSYEMLETALEEANIFNFDKIYCPFPNCSVLLDPRECLSTRASSSSQSDNSCVECPACQRFICMECGVPWHSSMSCEEYQGLPLEERDAGDITLHCLAQNKRSRRCQQCRRMIELPHGCYHMTCRCGQGFCYSCGAEYRDAQQTCQCAFWDEEDNSSEDSIAHDTQESPEQWAWNAFDPFPMIMDAYTDQERSQLALIQRFLAGGFSLSDHHPYQSPPRCTDSYVDAMKDLQQLPWLERFVSVISDNYYEEYTQ